ncbi:hypothetical protein A4X20_09855 [Mycolicibacterium iranicum]|uniref:Uncharacterized protein n=1 Tax=Mycolicibacterium iranicum TaxID=912594 RepID=A0A178LJA2_MYCIR|nr:hypothetical protein A4X20_09855 [Mycolicibacterium iranicum]
MQLFRIEIVGPFAKIGIPDVRVDVFEQSLQNWGDRITQDSPFRFYGPEVTVLELRRVDRPIDEAIN